MPIVHMLAQFADPRHHLRRRPSVCLPYLLIIAALVSVYSPSVQAADLFIAASNGESTSGALLADGSRLAQTGLLPLQAQVALRYQANRVYVIQGPRSEVMILIPSAWLAPVVQFSVGTDTDPRDIAVVDTDEIYVSRRTVAELIRVDVFSGQTLSRIDLSPLADADGVPEMTRMTRIGEQIYVLCQRLDRSRDMLPAGSGVLGVIDPTRDRLLDMEPTVAGVQGIDVDMEAPIDLLVMGDRLVVSGAAGIVEVDPATAATRVLLTAAELGGALQRLVLASNRQGFAVIQGPEKIRVVPVDLLTRHVGPPLPALSGGPVADLVIDGDRLIVADGGAFKFDQTAGLHIFAIDTNVRLHGPIRVGLRPARLVVVATRTITAVTESGHTVPPTSNLLRPSYPNPFNAAAVIPFDISRQGIVTLTIHDVVGQQVRTLHRGPLPMGRHRLTWDGRDDSGRPLASGVYLSRLVTGEGVDVRKLLHLQ